MRFFCFCLALIVLSACSPKPEQRGTAVKFTEVCSGKYWVKPIGQAMFKGERIAFPGHLYFSGGLQTDSILLDLYETSDKKGKRILVSVPVNGEKNGIDALPKESKQSDLRIYTNSGDVLGAGDRVIIHGEHIGDDSRAPACLFNTFIIEKG